MSEMSGLLNIVAIISVFLFIAVLFYKQANEQIEILQITAERLGELPTMYSERSPIIISDYLTPTLGSEAELQKREHIMQIEVAPQVSLRTLLASGAKDFHFSNETAEFLAKESGLDIWFSHHLYKSLLPSPYTSFIYSSAVSLWPYGRGLFKTTAFQTIFMPTQGCAILTLMLPKMLPYLPLKWIGRKFGSLTMQDTPLLNQIQFMEIKLRRGNLLILPAHLIVDIRSEVGPVPGLEPSWTFIAEIHHPISRLA